MPVSRVSAIISMLLFQALAAQAQGLDVIPDNVVEVFRYVDADKAFDTVSLVNKTGGALRVDSITIRFLDGGANPRPADFTACKTCPPDTISAYLYSGWLYGFSLNQSLRYLQDSLFLIQDSHGLPVTVNLAPGATLPFSLYYPVNCPACGRMPSYPGATRYAFSFIASEGSRAVLNVEVDHASAILKKSPSLEKAGPGTARDAAGRSNSGVGRSILYRKTFN